MYRNVPTMSPVWRRAFAPFQLGQTEVGDPHVAVHVEQKIRRLDVAVQHALPVSVGQGGSDLDAEPLRREVSRLGRGRKHRTEVARDARRLAGPLERARNSVNGGHGQRANFLIGPRSGELTFQE